MPPIWTTRNDVQRKAGRNSSSTANTTAYTNVYALELESMVNVFCRFNFSDAWTAGLNPDVKWLLTEVTTNLAAIYVINWDMSGYTSREEAKTMINNLREAAMRALSILRDKKQQDFINAA